MDEGSEKILEITLDDISGVQKPMTNNKSPGDDDMAIEAIKD